MSVSYDLAKASALIRPQHGGQRFPAQPSLLPEVYPMILHDPALRAACPRLHVGLVLVCKAQRLDMSALDVPDSPMPACGANHPVARFAALLTAQAGLEGGAFDLDGIDGTLHVRLAAGGEVFKDRFGRRSLPAPGEVILVDNAGHVHGRNWGQSRSARAALSERTRTVMVLVQGWQPDAEAQICDLLDKFAAPLRAAGGAVQVLDLGFADPFTVN